MKISFGKMNPVAFWRKRGFITRQCIVVGICGTLCMAGLSALAMSYAYRSMATNLRNQVMASVRGNAEKLEMRLSSARRFVEELAVALEYGDDTEPGMAELLARQLEVQRTYRPEAYGGSIVFSPPAGGADGEGRVCRVRFSGGRAEIQLSENGGGRDVAHERFFAVRDAGKTVWSEPFFDSRGGKPLLVTCGAPFYRKGPDGGRRFAGVVAIDLELSQLREIVQSHRAVPEGYSALISLHGLVITHPDPELSGRRSIFEAAKASPEVADIVRRMQKEEEGVLRVERTGILNEEVLYFFTPVPGFHWMLLSAFPTRLIYERLNAMRWMLTAGSLGGTALLVLLTSLVLRSSGKPLGQLEQAARRIGEGDFGAPLPDYPAEDEIGRLNHSIASMQNELQDRLDRLARSIAIREGFEHELQIARKIQQTLLPVFVPPLPECREFVLAARLLPARMVSGDLYDMFMLDGNRIALIIGDVSGKGVPAALLMSVVQTFQHCAACKCDYSGKMVTCLNGLLSKNNPDMMFITYFIGIVDLRTGVMNYTNAGHNPPMLIRKDGRVEELSTVHGLPIGMLPDEQYGGDSVTLEPGDGIFAFTDGVNETENPANDQFGNERLMRVLRNYAAATPDRILTELDQEIISFADGREFADDVTMWCFKLKATRDSSSETFAIPCTSCGKDLRTGSCASR